MCQKRTSTFHVFYSFSFFYCVSGETYVDMIFWITLFTQGASGSRQTSWPVFFRVALQRKAINRAVSLHRQESCVKVSSLSPLWRWDEGFISYMISVSSQWELGGISSTFSMWRPMGLLSVRMQRQCSSTPRLLRLIPACRQELHMVTKCNSACRQHSEHWTERN